jgi:hypothetical protein
MIKKNKNMRLCKNASMTPDVESGAKSVGSQPSDEGGFMNTIYILVLVTLFQTGETSTSQLSMPHTLDACIDIHDYVYVMLRDAQSKDVKAFTLQCVPINIPSKQT